MLCIFCCSTQRNIVYYLLIFCIPIRSPSIQYTSHFYLLWKVGIWAIENLNFKNHSLVIRNRIHHISQENSLPSLSMIRVCSQFIIFGVFFFFLFVIHFHSSCSLLSITHQGGGNKRQPPPLSLLWGLWCYRNCFLILTCHPFFLKKEI